MSADVASHSPRKRSRQPKGSPSTATKHEVATNPVLPLLLVPRMPSPRPSHCLDARTLPMTNGHPVQDLGFDTKGLMRAMQPLFSFGWKSPNWLQAVL